ncbi:putative transposase for insertion sequence element IS986/IS6110 [Arthrobacter mangrovi]|uniref:Transposase for insertion sequence element IS986/IS6110 n=1 Tax=Arthrobacter mangrovi TaxID=2966350 RepID=A0ABQ5MWD2_9MICC|nr:putative transposase for insertion sequence element IS986/IS6110 [Arthrobacter mangrovi]
MTAWLRRAGHEVAHCTVDRLMRNEGMSGVVRGRAHRTTMPGTDGQRAGDLLNRQFTADRPNYGWVTDFTYVRMWAGFAYVAFAIDLYSRAIVGWHAAMSKDTELVLITLKMALWRRDHDGHRVPEGMIHHSDAGSQYTSIRFTETLILEGLAASDGSVGDAYDNALGESTVGLYKTECTAKNSPFLTGPLKTLTEVEKATMDWVHWYNTERLHGHLGLIPPAEFETNYYDQERTSGNPEAPRMKTA